MGWTCVVKIGETSPGEKGVYFEIDAFLPISDPRFKVALTCQRAEKLAGRNLAIQGEIIGEGIQKNSYKIRGQALYVFNIFDIDWQRPLSFEEMSNFCAEKQLNLVPVVSPNFQLPAMLPALLAMADGPSLLNEKASREGWVLRTEDRSISFKAISNSFLEKEGGE